MAHPEKQYRIGLVSASVFPNEVEAADSSGKKVIRAVSLQRRYKDGDEWKTTTSFGLADLPAAIRVLELALRHVESKEAETEG